MLAGAALSGVVSTDAGTLDGASAPQLRRPGAAAPARSKPGADAPGLPHPKLPPAPPGVEPLGFAEFFQTPVGPRGLEITERLRALDGRRVRIFGYMVHEDPASCDACGVRTAGGRPAPSWMESIVPGRMLLTPGPAAVSYSHYGLADDLPAQTLFVTVPDKFGQRVAFTPGPMLLTGILSVGNKTEADGRISVVRLTLDPRAPRLAAQSLIAPSTTNQKTNP